MDFSKFMDILFKPINMIVVYAITFASGTFILLNFLSNEIIQKLRVKEFSNNYNAILLLIFLFSLGICILQILSLIYKVIKTIIYNIRFNIKRSSIIKKIDSQKILKRLYIANPDAVRLPLHNQKVKLLEEYNIIGKAFDKALSSSNFDFPFVLTEYGEKIEDKILNKISDTKR